MSIPIYHPKTSPRKLLFLDLDQMQMEGWRRMEAESEIRSIRIHREKERKW